MIYFNRGKIMKKRIISAIVAFIIVVPLIILGNYFFTFGVCVIAMLAYKELIDLKKSHNEYPKLMIVLGLFSMLSLVLSNYQDFTIYRGITYQIITMILLLLLIPTIFYKKDKYSMFENKIVRDFKEGKVTKEELDKCSTCDTNCEIHDGLSEASKEQLKDKTGEEIVNEDIAKQMKG